MTKNTIEKAKKKNKDITISKSKFKILPSYYPVSLFFCVKVGPIFAFVTIAEQINEFVFWIFF